MPRRRRPKPEVSPGPAQDPVEQFAALLRESAERDRAERERLETERERAREAARAEAEHAAAIEAARRDLDRAIGDARAARRDHSGVAAADDAWRRAKERLITLETGSPPDWVPSDRG